MVASCVPLDRFRDLKRNVHHVSRWPFERLLLHRVTGKQEAWLRDIDTGETANEYDVSALDLSVWLFDPAVARSRPTTYQCQTDCDQYASYHVFSTFLEAPT
jgi:hypothetical protein